MNKVIKPLNRVMYLRNANKLPVGCLAVKAIQDENVVEYQLSNLNLVDTCKKDIGRQLAIGRLVEKPVVLKVEGMQQMSLTDVFKVVLTDLVENPGDCTVSQKSLEAARRWLDRGAKT